MTNENETTLTAKAVKATKNTIKFEEEPVAGTPPVLGVIYVQKWWVDRATRITITIKKHEAA